MYVSSNASSAVIVNTSKNNQNLECKKLYEGLVLLNQEQCNFEYVKHSLFLALAKSKSQVNAGKFEGEKKSIVESAISNTGMHLDKGTMMVALDSASNYLLGTAPVDLNANISVMTSKGVKYYLIN